MTGSISELARRAHREYTNKGLGPLITNGVQFLIRDFWLENLLQKRSISRRELQEFAEKEGEIWYMQEEDPIQIDPPTNTRLRDAFDAYSKRYAPDRPFICELPDAYLLGNYAVGLTEDGRVITETAPVFQSGSVKKLGVGVREALRISGLKRRPAKRYKDEPVVSLVTPYASYYHWMTEYLPKLRLVDYYAEMTDTEPKIIVEADPREFVQDTLAVLGYPPSSCEEWREEEVHVERLVIPQHRVHLFNYYDPSRSNYNPSRDDLYWLRDRVRSEVETKTKDTANERVYVSRQMAGSNHTSSRKVLNYDELKIVLDEFGFKSYELENLSFQKQVEIFASADIVMGPHGAGLVNMIFSEDPVVIELFPENKLKPHFYFICEMMDFSYRGVIMDSEKSDLVVDTDDLRVQLQSVTEDI